MRGRMNGLRGRANANQLFRQNPTVIEYASESDITNFFANANTGNVQNVENDEVQILSDDDNDVEFVEASKAQEHSKSSRNVCVSENTLSVSVNGDRTEGQNIGEKEVEIVGEGVEEEKGESGGSNDTGAEDGQDQARPNTQPRPSAQADTGLDNTNLANSKQGLENPSSNPSQVNTGTVQAKQATQATEGETTDSSLLTSAETEAVSVSNSAANSVESDASAKARRLGQQGEESEGSDRQKVGEEESGSIQSGVSQASQGIGVGEGKEESGGKGKQKENNGRGAGARLSLGGKGEITPTAKKQAQLKADGRLSLDRGAKPVKKGGGGAANVVTRSHYKK